MNYYGYSNYGHGINNQEFPYVPVLDMSATQQQIQSVGMFTYPQNLQNALDLIQQALAGENRDRMFYSWLIENAPSDKEKEIITGIREAEISHYELFNQIYNEVSGMMPQQVPGEQFSPPENYCVGLENAILDEQNAVQKYREILYAMQNRVHINMMTEIITDAIRHGTLYNYLYAKNSCKG